eukprot:384670-Pelagomonas_calceolata.AAC.4
MQLRMHLRLLRMKGCKKTKRRGTTCLGYEFAIRGSFASYVCIGGAACSSCLTSLLNCIHLNLGLFMTRVLVHACVYVLVHACVYVLVHACVYVSCSGRTHHHCPQPRQQAPQEGPLQIHLGQAPQALQVKQQNTSHFESSSLILWETSTRGLGRSIWGSTLSSTGEAAKQVTC